MPASLASTQLESDRDRLGNPQRVCQLGRCSRAIFTAFDARVCTKLWELPNQATRDSGTMIYIAMGSSMTRCCTHQHHLVRSEATPVPGVQVPGVQVPGVQ